jgi:hypothetical protein
MDEHPLKLKAAEYNEDMLFADGFDEALIGTVSRCGMNTVALYNTFKCIEILMVRDGMTEEEAQEFFEFNTLGSYVGENTPCFTELFLEDI